MLCVCGYLSSQVISAQGLPVSQERSLQLGPSGRVGEQPDKVIDELLEGRSPEGTGQPGHVLRQRQPHARSAVCP